MARPIASLKQADLTRYLKAVRAAGFDIPRITIQPNGTVVIEPGSGDDRGTNPCDMLLK
ncbi:MAG: hypothetical protein AAFU80_07660 [Pseudomonadota bacterium]